MMSIVDVDQLRLANDQLKQCRICLDTDNPDDIISPCLCSGSLAYVHRQCLNEWRSSNAGGKAFKFCDICKFKYVIETVLSNLKTERKRLWKYYLFVLRDLTAIILSIQIVILTLAFLLKIVDKNSNHIKHLYPDSINRSVVYYLSAFVLLLAILGVFVLIIFCFVGNSRTSNHSFTRNNRLNSGKDSVNGIFFAVVIMVLICAFIGMFVGIVLSIIILKKIMKHHAEKIWLRQEAEKYIVQDFQERRNELENYQGNLSSQL